MNQNKENIQFLLDTFKTIYNIEKNYRGHSVEVEYYNELSTSFIEALYKEYPIKYKAFILTGYTPSWNDGERTQLWTTFNTFDISSPSDLYIKDVDAEDYKDYAESGDGPVLVCDSYELENASLIKDIKGLTIKQNEDDSIKHLDVNELPSFLDKPVDVLYHLLELVISKNEDDKLSVHIPEKHLIVDDGNEETKEYKDTYNAFVGILTKYAELIYDSEFALIVKIDDNGKVQFAYQEYYHEDY